MLSRQETGGALASGSAMTSRPACRRLLSTAFVLSIFECMRIDFTEPLLRCHAQTPIRNHELHSLED